MISHHYDHPDEIGRITGLYLDVDDGAFLVTRGYTGTVCISPSPYLKSIGDEKESSGFF